MPPEEPCLRGHDVKLRKPRRAAGLVAIMLGAQILTSCSLPAHRSGSLTYYLSPSGNDAATGTSPSTAWQSLGKANSVVIRPGTRLLLQGSQRFTGQLVFDARDAGDAHNPIQVGSYGKGRATIIASGSGIGIKDTAGIDIRNLSITGPASAGQTGAGINIYDDLTSARKLDHISIAEVGISGFANGIALGSANDSAGFRDVSVTNSALHDNLDAGMVTYGPPFRTASPSYANEDLHITNVAAYRNRGNPLIAAYSSGSGIVLGSVKNATVAWSTAYDNGGSGHSRPGPEGIWAYNSTHVTIEHNISFGNRTRNAVDGNGFGLDDNTSDSCMEYNLSYNNDGAGYLVYTSASNRGAAHNVVRFNISSGDAADRNPRFGGITVSGKVEGTAVYQNTVIMHLRAGHFSPALVLAGAVQDVTVRNNLFMTPTGPVIASYGLSSSAALLQGNDYYAPAPDWSVFWGKATYTSLQAWRLASGQETVKDHPVGLTANPELASPLLGLRARTPGDAHVAQRFTPRPGSPLVGAGLDLSRLFRIDSGPYDFSGAFVAVRKPDIGAQ
jgi:hypothetical protein